MMASGVIVVLSYPDTVVRPAYTEFSSKWIPLLGVGSKHAVQAGHAALLLIERETGAVDYYDFGRYITSFGYGRVRSKETDVELAVPLKAVFKEEQLINVEELLLWLEAHPEKTHGDGRLVAGLNYCIDYKKAKTYIEDLQSQKEVLYGAFVKNGSNCARFVVDTLIASSLNRKIKRKLKTSNKFTPSPIGNVIKGVSDDRIYVVENQQVKAYTNRSILKEYFACFFNKFDIEPNLLGTEKPDIKLFNLEGGTWLGGIGSGAWFELVDKAEHYQVKRYTSTGQLDFIADFVCVDPSFDKGQTYQIVHPTNCLEVVVLQEEKTYVFRRLSSLKQIQSAIEKKAPLL